MTWSDGKNHADAWTIIHFHYADDKPHVNHALVVGGHVDTVQELLKFPYINVNARNVDGYAALTMAARKNQLGVVKTLLTRQDLDVHHMGNKQDLSPLMAACVGTSMADSRMHLG